MNRILARLTAGLFICGLLLPAQAQTDDLITNDALLLMGAGTVIGEIGSQCVALTGNEPAVRAAFTGWEQRNQAWQVGVVATIGARGMPVTEASFAWGREKARGLFVPGFEASADKPDWCRQMARDLASQQATVATLFPTEAQRLEDARRGERPKLDVEGSGAVWSAGQVQRRFFEIEALMARCAEQFGDPERTYKDGYTYWRSRNVGVLQEAEAVLEKWGALAPERLETAKKFGVMAVDSAFFEPEEGRVRCEAFIRGVESGAEDIATTNPALFDIMKEYVQMAPELWR